jgi:hypothetical protein
MRAPGKKHPVERVARPGRRALELHSNPLLRHGAGAADALVPPPRPPRRLASSTPQVKPGGPPGDRTPNPRIERRPQHDSSGLYQALYPRRGSLEQLKPRCSTVFRPTNGPTVSAMRQLPSALDVMALNIPKFSSARTFPGGRDLHRRGSGAGSLSRSRRTSLLVTSHPDTDGAEPPPPTPRHPVLVGDPLLPEDPSVVQSFARVLSIVAENQQLHAVLRMRLSQVGALRIAEGLAFDRAREQFR